MRLICCNCYHFNAKLVHLSSDQLPKKIHSQLKLNKTPISSLVKFNTVLYYLFKHIIFTVLDHFYVIQLQVFKTNLVQFNFGRPSKNRIFKQIFDIKRQLVFQTNFCTTLLNVHYYVLKHKNTSFTMLYHFLCIIYVL